MCEATERQGNCMRNPWIVRPTGVIPCRSRYGLCCRSSRSQWHASGLARWIASAHTICPSPTVTAQGATHRHAMTQAPPIPSFPHQQAEKSRHNHHFASIPHGGAHRLERRPAPACKPKTRHATNTLCLLISQQSGWRAAHGRPRATRRRRRGGLQARVLHRRGEC